MAIRPHAKAMLGDLNHAGTFEEDPNYLYIWCFGESAPWLWKRAMPGEVVSCLYCIAAGPGRGL